MESTIFQNQSLEKLSLEVLYGEDLIKASLVAEKSYLACMAFSEESVKKGLELVKETDFYHIPYKEIYNIYRTLSEKGVEVTITNLSLELKDSGMRIAFGEILGDTGYGSQLPYYAKQIRSLAKKRELVKMARELIIANSNVESNVDLSVESVVNTISTFAPVEKEGVKTTSLVTEEVVQQIEKMRQNPTGVTGLSTGFHAIDGKLSGLHKTDLIILAARPARGKSSFVLQIAKNAALYSKTPVMFFSLEMGSDQLLQRILASESRVPLNKMRSGDVSDAEMSAIHAAKDLISTMPLYFDDRGATSVKDIRKQIKAFNDSSTEKIGLVVIDYLQLMAIGGKDNMVQAVTEISRGLKMLAKEFDVPVIALSQLSRSVESRGGEPRLSDLRDSGSIEQDADIVAFLHSESTEDNAYGEKNITFLVEKHRNGPTFKQNLEFNGARMIFREVASFDEFN